MGSPERITGAPNTRKTPTATAAGSGLGRPKRHGNERPAPSTVSRRTTGTVNSAVASVAVVNSPTTTIAAKPTGTTSAPGRRRPLSRSTSRPSPAQSASRTSGKTTHATKKLIGPGSRTAGSADRLHLARTGQAYGALVGGVVDLHLHAVVGTGEVDAGGYFDAGDELAAVGRADDYRAFCVRRSRRRPPPGPPPGSCRSSPPSFLRHPVWLPGPDTGPARSLPCFRSPPAPCRPWGQPSRRGVPRRRRCLRVPLRRRSAPRSPPAPVRNRRHRRPPRHQPGDHADDHRQGDDSPAQHLAATRSLGRRYRPPCPRFGRRRSLRFPRLSSLHRDNHMLFGTASPCCSLAGRGSTRPPGSMRIRSTKRTAGSRPWPWIASRPIANAASAT